MCDIPSIVDREEFLLRAIFEPSFLYPDGTLAPSAFYMVSMPSGQQESYISVFREKYCEEILKILILLKPREEGDKLCGYARLLTNRVLDVPQKYTQNVGVEVKSHPSKNYPSHAGIHIKIDSIKQTSTDISAQNPILMMIMKDLQKISVFKRI